MLRKPNIRDYQALFTWSLNWSISWHRFLCSTLLSLSPISGPTVHLPELSLFHNWISKQMMTIKFRVGIPNTAFHSWVWSLWHSWKQVFCQSSLKKLSAMGQWHGIQGTQGESLKPASTNSTLGEDFWLLGNILDNILRYFVIFYNLLRITHMNQQSRLYCF